MGINTSRKQLNVRTPLMITRTLNSNSASVSNAEDELDNERKILAQLNHQNIVSLVAALEGMFSGLGNLCRNPDTGS